MDYNSPRALQEFLNESGFSMKKRFGQNFLVDQTARERILAALDLSDQHRLWEIGPGIGAMTHMLPERVKDLTVFEIDHGFIKYLKTAFGDLDNFRIVEGDVLKTWPSFSKENPRPDRILGNLPYNVGSVIIASFIDSAFLPEKMVFVVQKEVAQRMVAKAGDKNYSSFSIFCQSVCDVTFVGNLPSKAFYPPPRVTSSIVSFVPHHRFAINHPRIFYDLIRDAFSSRRKMLKNNISRGKCAAMVGKEIVLAAMDEEQIPKAVRGEVLTLEQFVSLADRIAKLFDLSK